MVMEMEADEEVDVKLTGNCGIGINITTCNRQRDEGASWEERDLKIKRALWLSVMNFTGIVLIRDGTVL